MGTPVEKLTAAELHNGLPVVAALIFVAGKTDLIYLAENAGVNDFVDPDKALLKTPVVAGAGRLTAELHQLLCLFICLAEGFFHKNAFPRQKSHLCVPVMVAGTGRDIDYLNLGIGNQILDSLIGTAAELFCITGTAVGNQIAGCDNGKLIGALLQALSVNRHPDPSKTDNSDFNGI